MVKFLFLLFFFPSLAFANRYSDTMQVSDILYSGITNFQVKKNKKKKKAKNDPPGLFSEKRMEYELERLVDPKTGKLPDDIFRIEQAIAPTFPTSNHMNNYYFRDAGDNNYEINGPVTISGRIRAVAYDIRYNGRLNADADANAVIISGGVSGGIIRSADGGKHWQRVTPVGYTHSFTTIAQNTSSGNEDIWFAGGGEIWGNTAGASIYANYLGDGILRSVDNGLTWNRLTDTIYYQGEIIYSKNNSATLDHPFDQLFAMKIDPDNGNLYICCSGMLIRSNDNGKTFEIVYLSAPTPNFLLMGRGISNASYVSDITFLKGKKYIFLYNRGDAIVDRGLYVSTSGDLSSWDNLLYPGQYSFWNDAKVGRTIMDVSIDNNLYILSPNSNNFVRDFGQNVLTLLKYNPTTDRWSDLSANLPTTKEGFKIHPLSAQGGYDIFIKCSPFDAKIIFIGTINLFRSTSGFEDALHTKWIGGYSKNFESGFDLYPSSHPDMHNLVFSPANTKEVLVANDGGLQKCEDISAADISWIPIKRIQNFQFYDITINYIPYNFNFILGGGQDNGTVINFGQVDASDAFSQDYSPIAGGDGFSTGVSPQYSYQGKPSLINLYGSYQYGDIFRIVYDIPNDKTLSAKLISIKDWSKEFYTLFASDPIDASNMYFATGKKMYRTTKLKEEAVATETSNGILWDSLINIPHLFNTYNQNRPMEISSIEFSKTENVIKDHLYFGTSQGKIYQIRNHKSANTNVVPQDITPTNETTNLGGFVTDICINPSNVNELMFVVSNYNTKSVWISFDVNSRLPTWHNVEGNLTIPSVKACAIVNKKDPASGGTYTEYYLGTSIGLFSNADLKTKVSDNSDIVWRREAPNLINYAVVNDLEARPYDNFLLIGTHGNGMYKTSIGNPIDDPTGTSVNDNINDNSTLIIQLMPTVVGDATTMYYITNSNLNLTKFSYDIVSLDGRIVYSEKNIAYSNGSNNVVSSFPSGIYLIRFYSKEKGISQVLRFIKN